MSYPQMSSPQSCTVKPLHSHTGQPLRCTPLPDAEFLAVVADLGANDDGWEQGSIKRAWHEDEARIEFMIE